MSRPQRTSAALERAALRYADWGWPVLPLHTATDGACSCGDAGCASAGKHPRTAHGLNDASRRAEEIRRWWARWPHANVAIVTGTLVVLDVDGDSGHRTLCAVQRRHGRGLPATAWVQTARGRHHYFLALGEGIPNSAGRLGPGLDVRGARGYVVAPPSRHASGHVYRWHGLRDGLAPLPHWLARALTPPAVTAAPPSPGGVVAVPNAYVRAALEDELAKIAGAPRGTRNTTLNRAAFRLGQLAGGRLCETALLEGPLLEAALAAGLGEREASRTILSGLLAGLRSPRLAH